MHNPVLRVAAIHDISGFGRTSLTVVIPILSSMGFQVCPLPTAVLSTHTVDFTDFTFLDLTHELEPILDHWEHLNLQFDGVYSGFMASAHQMNSVVRCIKTCMQNDGLALVDPVLGDNGILSPTMTPEMIKKMQWLISFANIITPNFTEVTFLLNKPYQKTVSIQQIKDWLYKLSSIGPKVVVATSVPLSTQSHYTSVIAFDQCSHRFWKIDCPYIPAHYPGTGDTFASVLMGSLLQGDNLPIAIERAVQFVTMGIHATFGHGLPHREGILLERILETLHAPLVNCRCELME